MLPTFAPQILAFRFSRSGPPQALYNTVTQHLNETVEIQFKNKYLINRIGSVLAAVSVIVIMIYIYSAWFDKLNIEQNFIFIIGTLITLGISGYLLKYRTYEKATFSFIPEGIIIKIKAGYIPIKYDEIINFKSDGIVDNNDGKLEFIIQTKNSKKYRIKSNPEIYEGLIEVFPNKDGKYL